MWSEHLGSRVAFRSVSKRVQRGGGVCDATNTAGFSPRFETRTGGWGCVLVKRAELSTSCETRLTGATLAPDQPKTTFAQTAYFFSSAVFSSTIVGAGKSL